MRLETGLCVLHLFCKPIDAVDREAVVAAVEGRRGQRVPGPDGGDPRPQVRRRGDGAEPRSSARCAQLQTALQAAGLDVVDSYVSITEVSEYAKGMPEQMLQTRLYPKLPPEGKTRSASTR